MMIEQERHNRGRRATEQQRRAANPKKSVWVQASAGTGKTKVLSDRVLRILLGGGNPGRILCLTYTKAAAVEMSSRISERLSKWAVMPEPELLGELEALLGKLPEDRERLEKLEAAARRLFAVLLDTPGGMKIQTIHAFCQEILKRFPLEAHISPYFEVMDDRAAAEALADIQSRLLKKIEEEPNSPAGRALSFLTRKVSEFSFPEIMNTIAANRNKISQMLARYQNIGAIAAELLCRLGLPENCSETAVKEEFVTGFVREKAFMLMQGWMSGGVKEKEKAQKLAGLLERPLQPEDFDDYAAYFLNKDGGLPAKAATKAVLAAYPDFEEVFYAEAQRLCDLRKKLAAVRLADSTRAVLLLAEDLISAYNHFKKIRSKMDYEDLIVTTRQLLENKGVSQWVMFKLDGGIDNILIDEAQDTSPDQWAIIRALTEHFFDDAGAGNVCKTVFAVGDKKQSIYSFQGADPKGFADMQHYFSQLAGQEGPDDFDVVNLEVSFRSTAAVLETVNHVFRQLPGRDGVADDGEDITHIPFRAGEAGRVELWPLVEPEEGENKDVWLPSMERVSVETTSSKLAGQIAGRIKQMVESGQELKSQKRPVRYKDFMILVQRRNRFVEEMVRACKNVGVSIAGVDKIKLLEQIAVQDLVSLGKFLLLPTDDLTLAEVLKSPLFGLDDKDLEKLCCERGKGVSLWSRLKDDAAHGEVYRRLQQLSSRAGFLRPFEIYAEVLNRMGGRKKFISRLGYEAEDGLDEFMNLTIAYEQEHIPTLQGFIDWIGGGEVEIKRELEQSEADAVRIMTVHGSKGLQAPIVILPDTVRIVSVKNSGGMLWDDLFYYPLSSQDYDDNCIKIKETEKQNALREYRRLLYVALTRAEDLLAICGYYNSERSKPHEESWYKICEKSLREIGTAEHDDIIAYECPQAFEPKPKKMSEKPAYPECTAVWLKENPAAESALAKPLSPSRLEENEEEPALASPIGSHGKSRYRRGLIIHKLLQFLPEVYAKDGRGIIDDYLQKNVPDLPSAEKQRIADEVVRLLENPKFAAVFSAESKAEVPIMGEVNGRIISGQVDRLVVEKDRVLLVDYKTNRPAAKSVEDIPSAYLKQMQAYKDLLVRIYPEKEIIPLILWTDTADLMPLAE
ncbi:MAG: double-strand break repair helicase AddA [Alphaproteobacteria bacterium]|nr:double-strand break repair helicase AddA [Alphaproteobacteria bacterium]